MAYKIVIDPRAIIDIEHESIYYNGKQKELGAKFKIVVNTYVESLAKNPYYALRYKDYRGLPNNKFPFMIIFYFKEIEMTVFITALFNTYLNPKKYLDIK